MKKAVILDREEISQRIDAIARQIAQNNPETDELVLVGIRTGGAFLANRLKAAIARQDVKGPTLGILDITLYRDDWTRLSPTPLVGKTELPCPIDDKTVILVDDVLFTGRTVRAAMDALMDYGRPKKIELAILVDRGDHERELPIMANYVGGVWDTQPGETINVYLEEEGFEDHAAIEEKSAA